jgi:hypothetical protein
MSVLHPRGCPARDVNGVNVSRDEKFSGTGAAAPGLADDVHGLAGGYLAQSQLELRQGEVDSPAGVTAGEFVWLAHVDEGGVSDSGELGSGDLLHAASFTAIGLVPAIQVT